MPDYSTSVIYSLGCPQDPLVYIGSSTKPTQRLATHVAMSSGINTKFYSAMREIGIEHFYMEILELYPCGSRSQLEQYEYEVMSRYSREKLYNTVTTVVNIKQNLDPRYKNGKVYIIRNSVNDLIYVGSTIQLPSVRMNGHRNMARGFSTPLYEAMRKYGADSFQMRIIESYPCGSLEELEKREFEIIATYEPSQLYNVYLKYRELSDADKEVIRARTARGGKHYNFSRGSVSDDGRRWVFQWYDDVSEHHKRSFGYGPGGKLTSEEAYHLCVTLQNETFPGELYSPDKAIAVTSKRVQIPRGPRSEETKKKLSEAMRGSKHPKFNRGCIYDTGEKWIFEWVNESTGKTKAKSAAYGGPTKKGSRTSEQARQICIDKQNEIYPLDGEERPVIIDNPTQLDEATPTIEKLQQCLTPRTVCGYTVKTLMNYCRDVSVSVVGTKAQLAQRLLDYYQESEKTPDNSPVDSTMSAASAASPTPPRNKFNITIKF